MIVRKIAFAVLLLFISSKAESQQIDAKKSKINFGISNFGVNTVKGTFVGMQGEVVFNSNDISTSKVNVCIDASTIDTQNKKRDKHLKTDDFFDVEKYPKICFQSKNITKKDKYYLVEGELNLHGIKKNISIHLQYDKSKALVTGKFDLNRKDYNIGPNITVMVGKTATIEIHCWLKTSEN